MARRKNDPLFEALREGRSYTWTIPEGGDLASMRAAVKHGQTLTMSPIEHPRDIQVGDFVLVRWHASEIFHIVGGIQDERYLIVNSLGKVNGWVGAEAIHGRVTEIIEPEPRPSVEVMLDELASAYQTMITTEQASADDARRMLAIVDDLRWYAARIGDERVDTMPRSNTWSFQQNLWRLTRRTKKATAPASNRVLYSIDRGKECVGRASEILALLDDSASDRNEKAPHHAR